MAKIKILKIGHAVKDAKQLELSNIIGENAKWYCKMTGGRLLVIMCVNTDRPWCPDTWSSIILDVSLKMLLDKINV